MIGIIDYGVGNLFSLQASCKAAGQDVFVSGDGAELQKADRLILPGVGAFPDAAKKLNDTGMADFVREQAAKGTPLLGICLGMQLLFEESLEYGRHPCSAAHSTVEYWSAQPIAAAVEQGNLFGCQFHPEKSGSVGLSILRRFAEI